MRASGRGDGPPNCVMRALPLENGPGFLRFAGAANPRLARGPYSRERRLDSRVEH